MDDLKKVIQEKTKMIYAFIILIITLILAFFGIKFWTNSQTPEEKLHNEFKEMTKDYYENYYYDSITKSLGKDKFKTREKFELTLENISLFGNGKRKEFKYNGKPCNKRTSKVVITPKSPYRKKDYQIKTYLDCGMELKEKVHKK